MRHILLVEDDSGDVLLVHAAIRAASVDADVIIADDGEQADRLLEDNQPDLIVLDLNIPKLSGFQLLDKIRTRKGPPTFILTSSMNPADERRARELGARDYLVKPTRFDAFIATVGAAIERWIETVTAK